MLRKSCLILLFAFLCFPAFAHNARNAPWIFFDLGKTLINYARDYSQMRYLPGAHKYLKDLKKNGYHLGLLINWPEKDGKNNAEKLKLLKDFVAPRWIDEVPFDWKIFDVILFPPKDVYRKPHQYLFIEALRTAAPNPVVYFGEDKEEIQVAHDLGLTVHCVADGKGAPVPLIPIDDLRNRIR